MKIGDFNNKEEVEKFINDQNQYDKKTNELVDKLSSYNPDELMEEYMKSSSEGKDIILNRPKPHNDAGSMKEYRFKPYDK